MLAERDRLGREKALREQGAYVRLWSSADSSDLHGRVCRAYVASMVWNLMRRNPLIATHRALSGLAVAAPSAVRPGFWGGLRTRAG
jgi:hypothetical protein